MHICARSLRDIRHAIVLPIVAPFSRSRRGSDRREEEVTEINGEARPLARTARIRLAAPPCPAMQSAVPPWQGRFQGSDPFSRHHSHPAGARFVPASAPSAIA
ncbi:hypothetical protein MTO96_011299 [Rhipicephalus appendiculatus]